MQLENARKNDTRIEITYFALKYNLARIFCKKLKIKKKKSGISGIQNLRIYPSPSYYVELLQ